MSKVDFHILDSDDRDKVLRYICRLVRKAYKMGHKIYIRVENEEVMQQLDKMLWTFSDLDFIPHATVDMESGQEAVIIGMIDKLGDGAMILVNVGTTMPAEYASYSRVIEIIDSSPAVVTAGRERYRQYQQKKNDLSNHQVSVN